MKLSRFTAKRYRSLRDVTVELSDLNLFIGANASGKSTILDALRLLHEAVRSRDFRGPMFSRGGILNLAWKGEEAGQVELVTTFEDDGKTYQWTVRLFKEGYEFRVDENVSHSPSESSPRVQLLEANGGVGFWWSGKEGEVNLKQPHTSCALAAAAADASFPARGIAEFVERWGFFDPNPFLLRRDWATIDSGRFDPYGRNFR